MPFNRRQERLLFIAVRIMRAFFVHPEHLLMAGDKAGLADRRPAGARRMRIDDAGRLADQRTHLVARLVPAQKSHQHCPAAQRRDVARDIPDTTEHALRAL